ncbi:MAG: DEAD/DEAH box helicase [Acidimicrobiales bacterium]|nr:DEAD/DEAH box helicase [Acidimicrobiales bacterium]
MALAVANDIDTLVRSLLGDPRLAHVERLPARPARFAELAVPLPDVVQARLGVDRLYTHQAEAIDLVRAGTSVVVATGTASGKSLCYQAPIAEATVAGLRPATALAVFPTKALAQDQLRALSAMAVPGLVAATYDGDTGPEERTWVRANANVLLTNPEMLHHGILPHHERWATFLKRLRYVVVDELHLLRGIFGSHVAHLLRRLRRLCARYGADPTFVFASATIGAPARLATELCGKPVTAVTDDGSPCAPRTFVLWNPQAEADELRASTNQATAHLAAELIRDGHRTIVFCRSRKGTELVAADVKRRLPSRLARTVRPYRAGYLAAERREIEHELFSGELRGVVATSALELGVDVGGLDACVLNGFPGTIASMWQQAGRAGRDGREAMCVLVAGDDQLDQWLMAHPAEAFSRPPEPAVINVANPFVLDPHLACAAYESPLTPADERWWPGLLDDGVLRGAIDDDLRVRRPSRRSPEPAAFWSGSGWPAHRIGLRNATASEFRIVDGEEQLIGTVDAGRALRLVHPGAIYLHQGVSWRIAALDLDAHVAIAEPHDGGEYTQTLADTSIALLAAERRRTVGRAHLTLGAVEVTSQVTGYKRFDSSTGELLGIGELDLPPSQLRTRAFWYTVDEVVLHEAAISGAALGGTLHAVEHAAIGILPLFAICDRWDVGGVSTPLQADTGLPTIAIYDGYPGGAGVAELGFDAADAHLGATLEVIEQCPCTDGCPSCIQSPKCGNGNEPLDKAGAVALLHTVLGGDAGQ